MKFTFAISGSVADETKILLAGLRAGEGIRAASRAVQTTTRRFYGTLDGTRPNKQGWPRTHFFEAVARSVNQPVVTSPTEATVSITHHAIRQRIQGGYIRPTGGRKYLTLPATAEAYGKRAREFGNLRFGFAENKYGNLAPALVNAGEQKVSFGRRRKDGSRKVTPGEDMSSKAFFWLVKQVYQPADPAAFPPEADLEAAAVRGANDWARALTDRANKKKGPQT